MPLNETSSNTTIQYTVTTTRVADGTTLYWKTTGNVSNSDIVGGNTGSVTITNNQGAFNVTVIADNVTEGNETLGIAISTGSQNGPTVVSTANPITINDTSLDPYYALYSTGYNQNGELGLNDRTNRSSPTQVGSATNWRLIATGGYGGAGNQGVSAGIKTDGTLWLWGIGSYGRLGQGDTISRSSPTQVGALTSWSEVRVSEYGNHTMALRTDGTLWLWGKGNYGQLGQGDTSNQSSPVAVAGSNWSKIGGTGGVSAAIKTDGTLWVWGNNSYGKLGQGDNTNKNSPVQVGTGTDWARLSQTGGGTWMGAIKTNGTLWTWGLNYQTELGSNRDTRPNPFSGIQSPVQQTGSNWSRLAIGSGHGLGIKTDGTLWGWGNNSRNQLTNSVAGYGNITQIGTSTNWAEVSTSKYETVALKTDGTIWAWGKNTVGMLGLEEGDYPYISSPRQIGSRTNWNAVAVGSITLLTTNSI